jgi:hypothetical protein
LCFGDGYPLYMFVGVLYCVVANWALVAEG